jgi:hypothetical protein
MPARAQGCVDRDQAGRRLVHGRLKVRLADGGARRQSVLSESVHGAPAGGHRSHAARCAAAKLGSKVTAGGAGRPVGRIAREGVRLRLSRSCISRRRIRWSRQTTAPSARRVFRTPSCMSQPALFAARDRSPRRRPGAARAGQIGLFERRGVAGLATIQTRSTENSMRRWLQQRVSSAALPRSTLAGLDGVPPRVNQTISQGVSRLLRETP